MGSLRVGHDWATSLSLFTSRHWRRKWQPTPVFLPGESQGRGAWWAAVYGVAQSRTQLKRLSSSSSSSSNTVYMPTPCWLKHLCAHTMLIKTPSELWSPWFSLSLSVSRSLMDCSPPGSSVHGILQGGILEWVVMPCSRGSSQPRDQTWVPFVSCMADGFFTTRATWENFSIEKLNIT